MSSTNRRAFLRKAGSGMLASAIGLTLSNELDLHGLLHAGETDRIEFGDLEPLVSIMQETSPDSLMAKLKVELGRGVGLQTLITAAALANARTFGGQNYNGYHAFMAMVPALAMSRQLAGGREALPVFKVLYRNASFIQQSGGRRDEVLRPVVADGSFDGRASTRLLVDGRNGKFDEAEATLAAVSGESAAAAIA